MPTVRSESSARRLAVETVEKLWRGEAHEMPIPSFYLNPGPRKSYLHVIEKSGRGIIAKEVPVEGSETRDRVLVFFPSIEHAQHYAASPLHYPEVGGKIQLKPGAEFPGSVGALAFQAGEKTYKINILQGSYRVGFPETLTKSMAKHYTNWHKALLTHLLKQAKQERATVEIDERTSKLKPNKLRLFKTLAEALGFEVEELCEHIGKAVRRSQNGKPETVDDVKTTLVAKIKQ